MDLWCCLGGGWFTAAKKGDHCNETFFCNSFCFFLCASVLPLGHCVVAKAGRHWSLRDINILTPIYRHALIITLIDQIMCIY
jgi:hypothetical protein